MFAPSDILEQDLRLKQLTPHLMLPEGLKPRSLLSFKIKRATIWWKNGMLYCRLHESRLFF
jgi:hypothetical protein